MDLELYFLSHLSNIFEIFQHFMAGRYSWICSPQFPIALEISAAIFGKSVTIRSQL